MANPVFSYVAEERLFQLKDLSVPPKDYGKFLVEAVKVFKDAVLRNNGCKTLDDLIKRHKEEAGQYVDEEHGPIKIMMSGQLRFTKPECSAGKVHKICRSSEYFDNFFSSRAGNVKIISLDEAEEKIPEIIKSIDDYLDSLYPSRGKKMPNSVFSRLTKHAPTYRFISGFDFNLQLYSTLFTMLDMKVALTFNGVVSRNGLGHAVSIPAIRVTASELQSASDAPTDLVVNMDEVVHKYYEVSEIEYIAGFKEEELK